MNPLTVWITTKCGKFLKRWDHQIPYLPPDKPVCRSRRQNRPDMGKWTDSKWERSTSRLYLSPWLFNLHAKYIMWNARLDEAQAGIRIARRNINNLRCAEDITLMAESKKELKSLLMKVKEEWNTGLKLNIQKTKIMASSPITSWQNWWGKKGNSDRLCFLGLQYHCGWWLQPWN